MKIAGRRMGHGGSESEQPSERAPQSAPNPAGGEPAAVIGGGVAGLAAAAYLARDGYSVTLFEQHDCVGGRAGSVTRGGFRWDTGPSWYLMPEAFERFFQDFRVGVGNAYALHDLDPGYRLFHEGSEPIDVPRGAVAAAGLFESLEPGAGEQLRGYLKECETLYRLALEHFLYTSFRFPGPFLQVRVLRRLGTLLRLLAASLASHVHSRFRDPRIRQMLTYPAVFLSCEPARTPALYKLMSHTDLTLGVQYPMGGFEAVVEAIASVAREQGVRIRCGSPVQRIETREGQVTGVLLESGERYAARRVVAACDLQHTELALLDVADRTYNEQWFERRDPGIGAVVVLLGVRGHLPQLLHHNLVFSSDWAPDFDAVFRGANPEHPASRSVYVCKPSATDPSVAPEGHENLFVLIPTPADAAIGHGSIAGEASPMVERIADAALGELAVRLGVEDLAERVVERITMGPADFAQRWHAWGAGAIGPAHTLRQSALLRARATSSKVRGLAYAGGTALPGVGVPMCLISGAVAAEAVGRSG